jgi:myosin-5
MQIQYNITRIEEWCKSHDMPEGTLQLEHLMQATKLLQLKKVSHPLKALACISSLKIHRQLPKILRLSTTSAGC